MTIECFCVRCKQENSLTKSEKGKGRIGILNDYLSGSEMRMVVPLPNREMM